MQDGLLVLILYVLWNTTLLMALVGSRAALVLKRKHAINKFNPDGSDLSGPIHRLTRAQANCRESFPLIAGPILCAAVMQVNHLIDSLVFFFLIARVAQSLVHCWSISSVAVQIRFTFFVVQIAISVYWCVLLLQASAMP